MLTLTDLVELVEGVTDESTLLDLTVSTLAVVNQQFSNATAAGRSNSKTCKKAAILLSRIKTEIDFFPTPLPDPKQETPAQK